MHGKTETDSEAQTVCMERQETDSEAQTEGGKYYSQMFLNQVGVKDIKEEYFSSLLLNVNH